MEKIAIEWKIDFSEIRLFLENRSLEFHEIWHKNTLGDKWLEDWKNWTLTKEIQDMLVNLQRGISKDPFVKLLLK